jgi:Synaptobrevin/Regulated-SNARE-like domain
MTIIYTVIARQKDATVLVEVADSDIKGGNLSQIFIRLVEYFRDHPITDNGIWRTFVQRNNESDYVHDDFLSFFVEACTSVLNDPVKACTPDGKEYIQEEYFIHVYYYDGILFACLADDPESRDQKVSFAYLETLHKDFVRCFRAGRIQKCRAYTLDKEFTPTVRSLVHYHNVNHNKIRQEQRVRQLEAKVNDMKSILGNNITLLIQRNERLERLRNKSDELEDKVQVFRKKSKAYVREQRYKYYCYNVFVISLIILCIYIGLAIPCGFLLQKCEVSMKSNNRLLRRRVRRYK